MATPYLDKTGLTHFWEKLKGLFGKPEPPYQEVEWVESNGKQFVYLDWKPNIATWGFEADFLCRNATGTSGGNQWNASTNTNGYGTVFGTRNASNVNEESLMSYNGGSFCQGGVSRSNGIGWSIGQRVTMKYHGTTFTKPDGTTKTMSRGTETANKPYCNMSVFALWQGDKRVVAAGGLIEPSSTRIYSLKFYDGNTLEVNLVGAVRRSDGTTGLYDKISKHFYPATGMTYGNVVGDLGDIESVLDSAKEATVYAIADNITDRRLLRINTPKLKKLEDGQKINLTYLYSIVSSTQTTELAEWNDTGNSSYVYVKVTLADESETEWIPCFYNGASRLTTHYYAGHPLILTYRENVFIGATPEGFGNGVIMRGFFVDPDYNSDRLYELWADTVIAGKNGIKRYSLCMRDDEGNWTSIMNESNNANVSGKTCYTGGLQLGKVLYHSAGSDYALGTTTSNLWDTNWLDVRYDFNGITSSSSTSTLQIRKPFYLVGTLGNDGLFYLDTTKWWTQTKPTSEDGKVYVFVGNTITSYYQVLMSIENPAFVYKNGRFQEIFNGHTIEKDVPSNAVFTDTTYNDATTSVHGLMSATDKGKIDKLSFDSNNKINSSIIPDIYVKTSGNQTISDTKTFSAMPVASAGLCVGNSGTAGGLSLWSDKNVKQYGLALRTTADSGKHGYVQGDYATYNYMYAASASSLPTRSCFNLWGR